MENDEEEMLPRTMALSQSVAALRGPRRRRITARRRARKNRVAIPKVGKFGVTSMAYTPPDIETNLDD